MGTRHLICVVIDGDYKVAQYGQWDGYPSGQGSDVVNFLSTADLDTFKEKVRACRWLTPSEIETINNDENWKRNYPYLSRDAGAGILAYIQESNGLALSNQFAFAANSLMCEYAYVIDLDNHRLEVYKGFVKTPHTGERFSDMPLNKYHIDEQYYPVQHWHTFPISKQVPIKLDFFLETLSEKEDEEA